MKKAESRRARAMTGVCPHCGGKLTGEPAVMARHRYALWRRRGLWLVVFDGEEAQFKHEKGVEYVARLLAEQGPFHGLDLASKAGGNSPRLSVERRASKPGGGRTGHGRKRV